MLPQLLELLKSSSLITTNHAIIALGLIAKNKTQHKKNILLSLLSIVDNDFKTEQCLNIAIGKLMKTYLLFAEDILKEKRIIQFVNQTLHNDNQATRPKAQKLLKLIMKNQLSS